MALITHTATTTIAPAVPPNQSLYIQNLPEKLQKEDLKRELYMLFSTYAPVIHINALKTPKMRGQAHVLFRDVQSATQAMRSCQSFDFFGREMRISYSKNRSHALSKLTGTFNQPSLSTGLDAQAQKATAPTAFPPPPASFPAPPTGLPPPSGLPAKANGVVLGLQPPEKDEESVASPQGTKRQREESDDEDAAMEEDDDDEGEMEMSDDD